MGSLVVSVDLSDEEQSLLGSYVSSTTMGIQSADSFKNSLLEDMDKSGVYNSAGLSEDENTEEPSAEDKKPREEKNVVGDVDFLNKLREVQPESSSADAGVLNSLFPQSIYDDSSDDEDSEELGGWDSSDAGEDDDEEGFVTDLPDDDDSDDSEEEDEADEEPIPDFSDEDDEEDEEPIPDLSDEEDEDDEVSIPDLSDEDDEDEGEPIPDLSDEDDEDEGEPVPDLSDDDEDDKDEEESILDLFGDDEESDDSDVEDSDEEGEGYSPEDDDEEDFVMDLSDDDDSYEEDSADSDSDEYEDSSEEASFSSVVEEKHRITTRQDGYSIQPQANVSEKPDNLPATIKEYLIRNPGKTEAELLKLYPKDQLNRELKKGKIYKFSGVFGA